MVVCVLVPDWLVSIVRFGSNVLEDSVPFMQKKKIVLHYLDYDEARS